MKSFATVFFVLLAALGCSNEQERLTGQSDSGRFIVQLPDAFTSDAFILPTNNVDAEIDATVDICPETTESDPDWCVCNPDCCTSQTWFCPPEWGNTTLYTKEVIYNICNENKEPCVYGQDENCPPPSVIYEGDCEEAFECDPTSPMDFGAQPCELEDGTTGLQNVQCDKGRLKYGPCEACDEEICDGEDNDCDGLVDEGSYPCLSECGEGQGICVEGEVTACDAPLPVPEFCDNLDNDCDGLTDEELVQICETDCEQGIEFCIEGNWTGCTAQQPLPEQCNGMDDNCNGTIDENLNCACPPEMIGFLVPCMEDPLLCGQGYKTCQCSDEDCTETEMTQCFAACNWVPNPDPNCDILLGLPTEEVCNNFDDNCNELIDEDLFASCYSGPEGTANQGVCLPGEMICFEGQWGSFINENFIDEACYGEVLPIEEDLCTGQDDNCDGIIEKTMEETDIVFIVDISGSMSGTINAIQNAMSMFASHYSDQEVIQWGLIIGPVDGGAYGAESLQLATNLVSFDQFLPVLASVDDDMSSKEMIYDAIYLAIRNLAGGLIPIPPQYHWDALITSNPPIENFTINWREDAKHVVVVFTDEPGQSFLNPEITQNTIIETAQFADELSIYTFTPQSEQNGLDGFGPISINGSWNQLSAAVLPTFEALMQILDETACGN